MALAMDPLKRLARAALIVVACGISPLAQALSPELLQRLAKDDNDAKTTALEEIALSADPAALPVLTALQEGRLKRAGERVLIEQDGSYKDAATGAAISSPPQNMEDVVANNRIRREVGSALAALKLVAPEREVRLAAAKALQKDVDPRLLPILSKALERESDSELRGLLALLKATAQVHSKDPKERLAAVQALGESTDPATKTVLLHLLEKNGEVYKESDPALRGAAERSLQALENRLAKGEWLGRIFSGASLGSILLLAALGLAITYGLMGVINMAHGELIMIGAYATYVVQNAIRAHFPDWFAWYPLAAVPMAFLAAALVGIAMERGVIRFLYGRPLETLLATWGLSLVLMQTVRTLFGAQNVTVENPSWMSGGIQVLNNLVLPYNRIAIIFFAAFVLVTVWLLLTRTRLGLYVRAVTQNRPMAGSLGVATPQVDMWAFGLGSGVAGLAGCALSQVGNVGPDLGQAYIVDSFMVVVLGGVGQLAGTVYAALGLGVVNKFLEAWSGAVLAKIAVLVFIILFIQKRPQGLFALKGRMVDA